MTYYTKRKEKSRDSLSYSADSEIVPLAITPVELAVAPERLWINCPNSLCVSSFCSWEAGEEKESSK